MTLFQSRFGVGDVDVQRQERSFSGYFSVDTLTLRHRLHSGEWSDSMRREVFQRGDAVAVLPWDMATDELVLIEQLRVGAIRDNDSPWMLELIAGACSEQIRVFVGELMSGKPGTNQGLDSEHEDILVHQLSRHTVLAMLDQGQINNGHTLIALYWLARHRERLRTAWLDDQND